MKKKHTAADAVQEAIRDAKASLSNKKTSLFEAEKNLRFAGNTYDRALEGIRIMPPAKREKARRDAEKEYQAAEEARKQAALQVAILESNIATLERQLEHALSQPDEVEPPSAAELEQAFIEAREKLESVASDRMRVEARIGGIKKDLAAIEWDRQEALKAGMTLEEQAERLALIPVKRELLAGQLEEAEADFAAVRDLENANSKSLCGHLNGKTEGLFDAVRSRGASLRAKLNQLAIGRLSSALSNCKDAVNSTSGSRNYAGAVARFARGHDILSPVIEKQLASLAVLEKEMEAQLARLDEEAARALAELEGGDQ